MWPRSMHARPGSAIPVRGVPRFVRKRGPSLRSGILASKTVRHSGALLHANQGRAVTCVSHATGIRRSERSNVENLAEAESDR